MPGPGAPAGPTLSPASVRLLAFLSRLPRLLLVALVLAVLLGGALLPGWAGAALILVVAALLAWLCRLTWAVTAPAGRAARIAATAVLVLIAALKVF